MDKLILPELHSAVANITSEYNARALYTDARAQLTQELRQYLQDKLGHKGIVIEDVLLRAIKLPEQLTKAIQDKLRTEQVGCFESDSVGIMLSVCKGLLASRLFFPKGNFERSRYGVPPPFIFFDWDSAGIMLSVYVGFLASRLFRLQMGLS